MYAYLLLERDQKRSQLVKSNIDRFPFVKVFKAVDSQKWDLILKLYKTFKIKAEIRNEMYNVRGKYAKWASMILIWKYMLQFNIKHLVFIEDDVNIPKNTRKFVNSAIQRNPNFNLIRFGRWTRFCVFSNKGAKMCLYRTIKRGIKFPNDMWLNKNVPHIVSCPHIEPVYHGNSEGNIMGTPRVDYAEFDYEPTTCAKELINTKIFINKDDLDQEEVIKRL